VYLEMATKNLPKSADARFGLALARMLQGALDDAERYTR
jgi:predicted Zn-dependent protease